MAISRWSLLTVLLAVAAGLPAPVATVAHGQLIRSTTLLPPSGHLNVVRRGLLLIKYRRAEANETSPPAEEGEPKEASDKGVANLAAATKETAQVVTPPPAKNVTEDAAKDKDAADAATDAKPDATPASTPADPPATEKDPGSDPTKPADPAKDPAQDPKPNADPKAASNPADAEPAANDDTAGDTKPPKDGEADTAAKPDDETPAVASPSPAPSKPDTKKDSPAVASPSPTSSPAAKPNAKTETLPLTPLNGTTNNGTTDDVKATGADIAGTLSTGDGATPNNTSPLNATLQPGVVPASIQKTAQNVSDPKAANLTTPNAAAPVTKPDKKPVTKAVQALPDTVAPVAQQKDQPVPPAGDAKPASNKSSPTPESATNDNKRTSAPKILGMMAGIIAGSAVGIFILWYLLTSKLRTRKDDFRDRQVDFSPEVNGSTSQWQGGSHLDKIREADEKSMSDRSSYRSDSRSGHRGKAGSEYGGYAESSNSSHAANPFADRPTAP